MFRKAARLDHRMCGFAFAGMVPSWLMDAGKCLPVKVVGKKLEGHWLDITVSIDLKEV